VLNSLANIFSIKMDQKFKPKATISNSLFEVAQWPFILSQATGYLPIKLDRFQNLRPRNINNKEVAYPTAISLFLILISIITAFLYFSNVTELLRALKQINSKSANIMLLVSTASVLASLTCTTCVRLNMLTMQDTFFNLWTGLVDMTEFIVTSLRCQDQFQEGCKRLTNGWQTRIFITLLLSTFAIASLAYAEFSWEMPMLGIVIDLLAAFICCCQFFSLISMEYFLQVYSLSLDVILHVLKTKKSSVFWTGKKGSRNELCIPVMESYKKVEREILEFNKAFNLRMSIEVSSCLLANVFGEYFVLVTILGSQIWSLNEVLVLLSSVMKISISTYFLFRVCRISSDISAKGRELIWNTVQFMFVKTIEIDESPTKVLML